MSMTCRKHRHKNGKINNSNTRTVDGVKCFFMAGVWYCDYNVYTDIVSRQGRTVSIERFFNFCDHWDLCPTG